MPPKMVESLQGVERGELHSSTDPLRIELASTVANASQIERIEGGARTQTIGVGSPERNNAMMYVCAHVHGVPIRGRHRRCGTRDFSVRSARGVTQGLRPHEVVIRLLGGLGRGCEYRVERRARLLCFNR